jgi:hypothetical protein
MNGTMTEVVDEGRRPDRLGRVRTPRERREELLAEYESSGRKRPLGGLLDGGGRHGAVIGLVTTTT